MHKLVIGLLGATAFAAATAASAQVTSLAGSGDLGAAPVTYTTADGPVVASGFDGTTAVDLFGKNLGGDENGVGLADDGSGQHEIQAGNPNFIQLNVSGLSAGTVLAFMMGSTTDGEVWNVVGTDTADCWSCLSGSPLLSGTDETMWHSLGVPAFTYYDFYATGTSAGNPSNVLLAALDVTSVPEPSTWAMMLLGFGAIGIAARRSRRKVALAQLA